MTYTDSAIGHLFDVVVIGSGFGGAAVACRLAQAGRHVAILERGKRYPLDSSSGDQQFEGHFQTDQFETFSVIRGKGVGGGSLHYYNVRLRTPADIFENGRWPREVTRETLEPYYDLVNGMFPASPLQPNPFFGQRGYPERSLAFNEAAAKCVRCQNDPEFVNIAVHSASELVETPAGILQTTCVFCGECMRGCPPSKDFDANVNARSRLDLTYLAVAEQNGATIFPNHQVSYLDKSNNWFSIHTSVIDPDSEEVVETGMVVAPEVVLAAGSLGSTEILLRSYDYLPFMSERLGHNFSPNGDFLFARTKDAPQELGPQVGPMITVGADFSTEKHRILIEDVGREVTSEFAMLLPKFVRQGQSNQMNYVAMGNDESDGHMELDESDNLKIHWDASKNLPLYEDITAGLQELSTQLGGTYEAPPGYDSATGNGLLTAHPLGGCPMGDTPEQGVVSPQGEVYGVSGLYVADAAIIPSALAVNPSYTISALAERVAFWMIYGREMTAGDPSTPMNQ